MMKKVTRASVGSGGKAGKENANRKPEPAVPSAVSEGGVLKKWRFTKGIDIRGVGESAEGERFLEVAVKSKSALLNVDNISASQSSELKKLTRLGEPLIKSAAKTEFIDRAHDAARAEPSFKVAKMTGYCDGQFVFPEGLASEGESDIRRAFDYRYRPYHRRLHREGSPKGWVELAKLCKGKSRLITGLCVALSGPVCGKFGDEPPGVQLISKGGLGNTTIGRVICTVWGGDRNPTRKIGCGVSWNNTGINFEVLAGAFNHMFVYTDDMHNAGEAELKAIQNVMNGEGRGRSTDDQHAEFCTPIWSSSNASIIHTAKELKRSHLIVPLIDRLMELSVPADCPYFFEGIKTKEEMRVYGNQLRKGARENFGWAGPEFVKRLGLWAEADLSAVESFRDQHYDAYFEAAADIVSPSGRDLGRIENKFATIYVTGCLAADRKILPFNEPDILDAVLTCHRDHVGYVDQQMTMGGARLPDGAGIISPVAVVPKANAGALKPAERPFDRMRRFVNANRKGGFADLDKANAGGSFAPSSVGYKHKQGRGKNRHTEFLIPDVTFEEVAGGSDEAGALKRELLSQGLIIVHGKGSKRRFSIRRTLPDGSRPNFIVLRYKPKE
jgi:hypothetical protein